MDVNYHCSNLTHQVNHTPFTQAHKNLWTQWVDVLSASVTNTVKLLQNKPYSINKAARETVAAFFFSNNIFSNSVTPLKHFNHRPQ